MQLYGELGIAQPFMMALGLWRLTIDSSMRLACLKYLLNMWVWLNIMFSLVPAVLFFLLENISLTAKFELLAPLFYYMNHLVKYYLLISRNYGIDQCLEHVAEDWKRTQNIKVNFLWIYLCIAREEKSRRKRGKITCHCTKHLDFSIS